MTWRLGRRRRVEAAARYWFLPVAFVVHDAEELATMPAWLAAHRSAVTALADRAGISASAVEGLPSSTPAIACAMAVLLALFLVVTAGARRAGCRGPWLYAYATLLGGFFLHAFTHLGQAAYFGGYTPGVVTAAVVVLPVSSLLYRRLLGARLLSVRAAAAWALLGIALVIPALLLALSIGALASPR